MRRCAAWVYRERKIMNLRKKCIALALAAVMFLAAGCGQGSDTTSASAEKESAPQALDLVGSEGNDDAHNAGDEHGEDHADQDDRVR